MEYITVKQAAERWGISVRRIQNLCGEDRIPGAVRFNRSWAIPADAVKPSDERYKKTDDSQEQETELLQFAPYRSEFLERIVEDSPYAIAVFTPDGTLTYANEAYFRTFFIEDKMKVLGKLNLLRDEITKNSGMAEIALRSIRGESHLVEDNKVPIQEVINLVGNGLPQGGIFYMTLITYPIRDKNNKLAYTAAMFLPTREYKGREEFIKSKEYIENHWLESFDLSAVATAAGLSRAQLIRMFKKTAQTTPYEYYLKIKMNRLKEKLLDVNLSVAQAFAACGMDYNGHYAGLFKEQAGETPMQYRKKSLSQ